MAAAERGKSRAMRKSVCEKSQFRMDIVSKTGKQKRGEGDSNAAGGLVRGHEKKRKKENRADVVRLLVGRHGKRFDRVW